MLIFARNRHDDKGEDAWRGRCRRWGRWRETDEEEVDGQDLYHTVIGYFSQTDGLII